MEINDYTPRKMKHNLPGENVVESAINAVKKFIAADEGRSEYEAKVAAECTAWESECMETVTSAPCGICSLWWPLQTSAFTTNGIEQYLRAWSLKGSGMIVCRDCNAQCGA